MKSFDFLEQKNTTPENISDHLDGFVKPVESFDIPDEPEIPDANDDEIENKQYLQERKDFFVDEKSIKEIHKIKRKAAKTIVNVPSKFLDWLLSTITGIDESKRYIPDKEDLKDIEDIVFEMLPDKFNISPWFGLILAVGAAYLPIITTVKKDMEIKNSRSINTNRTNYFEDVA